ncbi:MAG TPA: hypothetical protein VM755_17045 [Stellaceae bacterium]|nr:hypothetical protein [Stellaceae bacterium]
MTNKLKMEFQPIFMAGHALGKKYKSHWKKIRDRLVPKNCPTCSVCGFVARENRGLIHADEVWEFPGPPKALLTEVRPLCVYCHEAKDYYNLLIRMQNGIAAARLAGIVQEHYCKTNGCTEEEFSADFKAASAEKQRIEKLYGYNCAVEVSYGKWTPPERPPGLKIPERQAVRTLFVRESAIEYDKAGEPIGGGTWYREDPIKVRDREIGTFSAAVRWLNSLPPEERAAAIQEMQDAAELADDYDDGEYLPDHEFPQVTAMWRDTVSSR